MMWHCLRTRAAALRHAAESVPSLWLDSRFGQPATAKRSPNGPETRGKRADMEMVRLTAMRDSVCQDAFTAGDAPDQNRGMRHDVRDTHAGGDHRLACP